MAVQLTPHTNDCKSSGTLYVQVPMTTTHSLIPQCVQLYVQMDCLCCWVHKRCSAERGMYLVPQLQFKLRQSFEYFEYVLHPHQVACYKKGALR